MKTPCPLPKGRDRSCLRGILQTFSIMLLSLIILTSCEEVVEIDLNTANPAFVVEGFIAKDAPCYVRISQTSAYFSPEEDILLEDAVVTLSDGDSTEVLAYSGSGYYNYEGTQITGIEGKTYYLEIVYDGVSYQASSYLPKRSILISTQLYQDETPSIANPLGEKVITISCSFIDDPEQNNFYMVQFIKDETLLDNAFYLMTESTSNVGSFRNEENILSFEESIFYEEEGTINIFLYSIDEAIYNYFFKLNDILFWKRRVMPPSPYNPESNISNGALGYFAAWSIDLKQQILEW